MAIGDDALSEGYLLVPNEGLDGKVRYGAREINRTRDYIALVSKRVPANKAGFRTSAGITSGTANPSGGANGDIYLKIL